jgi:hypothetical protein
MITEQHRRDRPTSPRRRRSPRIEPFVWGVIYGQLFVVPRKVAAERARLNRALHTSKTWGEVVAKAPRRLCQQIREALDVRRISADREIGDILENLVDQCYPPSLGVIMLASLPTELKHLVHREFSALGDELPSLRPADLTLVLEVCAARGIVCDEDQALVVAAAGYDTDDPEEMRQ